MLCAVVKYFGRILKRLGEKICVDSSVLPMAYYYEKLKGEVGSKCPPDSRPQNATLLSS